MAESGHAFALQGGEPARASLPLRYALRWFSPAGSRARLSVLIFHRVHAQRDPVFSGTIDASTFRIRMQWLRELFNVLPLEEAVARLERGSLPERAAAITFDDGYADNATVALPILRELGLHATFFVASGFLDGGRMWNDTVSEAVRRATGPELDASAIGLGRYPIGDASSRRAASGALLRTLKYLPEPERSERVAALERLVGAALPRDLMMTSSELRALAGAGMGIGGHTISHPILTRLSAAQAQGEIGGGREALEAIVRQPVRLFAYPNGKPDQDYGRTHADMVERAGFAAAFSTAPGSASGRTARYELPRFTPWDRSLPRYALRMLRNLHTPVQAAAA